VLHSHWWYFAHEYVYTDVILTIPYLQDSNISFNQDNYVHTGEKEVKEKFKMETNEGKSEQWRVSYIE
jgi:hypothetical protein